MPRRVRLLTIVAIALLGGCAAPGASGAGSEDRSMPTMTLSSPAFVADGSIPVRFTCDGVDVSPALAWSGSPSGTAAYALIVDDPDAGGFVHWIALDLPVEPGCPRRGRVGGGRARRGHERLRPGRLERAVPAVGNASLRLRAVRARPSPRAGRPAPERGGPAGPRRPRPRVRAARRDVSPGLTSWGGVRDLKAGQRRRRPAGRGVSRAADRRRERAPSRGARGRSSWSNRDRAGRGSDPRARRGA